MTNGRLQCLSLILELFWSELTVFFSDSNRFNSEIEWIAIHCGNQVCLK